MSAIALTEVDPWADDTATFAECDLCGHRQLDDFMRHHDHALRAMYRPHGDGFTVCETCLPDFLREP